MHGIQLFKTLQTGMTGKAYPKCEMCSKMEHNSVVCLFVWGMFKMLEVQFWYAEAAGTSQTQYLVESPGALT